MTITLRSANESILSRQTFATSVASGKFKVANPYAVDAWVGSFGSNALVAEIEFGPFEIEQLDGENRMKFDARIGNTVASTQGRIWYVNKCGRVGVDGDCNYQEPRCLISCV